MVKTKCNYCSEEERLDAFLLCHLVAPFKVFKGVLECNDHNERSDMVRDLTN